MLVCTILEYVCCKKFSGMPPGSMLKSAPQMCGYGEVVIATPTAVSNRVLRSAMPVEFLKYAANSNTMLSDPGRWATAAIVL